MLKIIAAVVDYLKDLNIGDAGAVFFWHHWLEYMEYVESACFAIEMKQSRVFLLADMLIK